MGNEFKKFIFKYRGDIALNAGGMGLAMAVAVFMHGQVKGYTPAVATVGTVVFTVMAFVLIALASLGQRGPRWFPVTKRIAANLAIASVLVPTAFLKVETLAAPLELARRTDSAAVIGLIRTGNNLDQLRAWARLQTLPAAAKDELAASLVPLLLGDDERARASAALTLQVALRRHTIAFLIALAPQVEGFLRNQNSDRDAARAAALTRQFVTANTGAIRRALEPSHRPHLPAGGVAALMLALATEAQLGHAYLEIYAQSPEADLRTPARAALGLAH